MENLPKKVKYLRFVHKYLTFFIDYLLFFSGKPECIERKQQFLDLTGVHIVRSYQFAS